jgi:GAF domain-containing protein
VHEAGKVISAASVGLDKQQVLDRILEQAIVHITGVDGQEASVGTIHLLEKETGDLLLESVYPKDYPKNLLNKFKRISLNDRNLSSKIGISGKAVSMRQALLVPDVSKDKDYIWHNENTKSELAIPMFDKDGNILGVMDVESRHINGFDNLDKDSLSLLVEMAVIAIQNSDQTMQLSRSNAVALMGAWGAEIAHILNREVGNIRRGVALLRQQFGVTDKIVEELNVIDRSASQLALPEIPEQIPGYDFASSHASCDLNTTIQWAIDVFRAGHPGVQIFFETGDVDIKVAMHERFVYLMAINLLRNSEHAVALSDEKNIYLRTRIDDLSTLFEIENTGATLRPEIIPQLFKQLIPHQDGRKGRGLLLVGFIVEQHGGRIEVVQKNKNVGACFRFWLPLAQKQNEI